MDDGWDLRAVVKSCSASTAASSAAAAGNISAAVDVPSAAAVATTAATLISFDDGRCDHEQPSTFSNLISFSMQPVDCVHHGKIRKGKNNKKVVEMREEEVSNDGWAWRKYGQKPIKGSPHQRNYYRCSTTRDCSAKKHVERNPANGSSTFLVSYFGYHLHPRPTNLRSHSGATMSTKFSPVATHLADQPACSSSSPASTSSFSPMTSQKGDETEANDEFRGLD